MDNRERYIILLTICRSPLTRQAMRSCQLTVIRGVNYNSVVRNAEIVQFMENLNNIVINVLDAIEVLIDQAFPVSIFVRYNSHHHTTGISVIKVGCWPAFFIDGLLA